MTSYTSEIPLSSTMIAILGAALGAAAYMVYRVEEQRKRQGEQARPLQNAASAIHADTWGKQWPKSEGTIYKTEIDHETGSVDDDEIYGLADKFIIPPHFKYRYFTKIRRLKTALYTYPGNVDDDVLVVREEYETLRQALEDDSNHTRSIVVTGHPGIGKSTFLLYLLLHRLERKLPTAVQFGAYYYLIFDKRGARVNSLNDPDPRLGECWALTDSNNNVIQPCEPFQNLAERVILASPPERERWREWIKQENGCWIISNLPSVPEIAAIVKERRKLEPSYDPSSTLSLSCASGDHRLGTSYVAWNLLPMGASIPLKGKQQALRYTYPTIHRLSSKDPLEYMSQRSNTPASFSFALHRMAV
ncbi:hypothetical protein M408DRAFT_285817 [Serendipita vermifera MAFF 305830]|uniref:Uncharacterized protein n=1 Tax=Serendipita vermifera MAFF 305830 TaxID=933852 RepID=A0A0C3B107_SERVB|nr:hypothetical protein M408DRAFT_285817 [Serendipita vermifera MAFF 305830]